MSRSIVGALTAGAMLGIITLAAAAPQAPGHDMQMHMQHHPPANAAPVVDSRTVVHFPDALRIHTLANMRDHLLAMQEIQEALAGEAFERAAEIAEQRLGMSSLPLHGAHEVAQYMPAAMRAIGSEMHRSASRFAAAARDAGVTGDMKPVLAGLARVTQQCVGCHGGYRVQ